MDFLEKKFKNDLKWLDGRLGFQTQLILSLLLTYCRTLQSAFFVLCIKPISLLRDTVSGVESFISAMDTVD